jgi:hypothetical protein
MTTSPIPSLANLAEVERGSANPIGIDEFGNRFKIDVQRNPHFKADGNLIDNGDIFVQTDKYGVGISYPFGSTDINDFVRNTCCLVPKWKVNSENVFPIGSLESEFSYDEGLQFVTVPITPNIGTAGTGPNTQEVKILCSTAANFTEKQSLTFETDVAANLNDSHFDVPEGAKMYLTFEIEGFYSPEDLKNDTFVSNPTIQYTIGTETVEIQKSTGTIAETTKATAWENKLNIKKTFDLPALLTDEDVDSGKFFWFFNIKMAFDSGVVSSTTQISDYFNADRGVYFDNALLVGKTKIYDSAYTTNWVVENERWGKGWKHRMYDTSYSNIEASNQTAFNFIPDGHYSSSYNMPITYYGLSFGAGNEPSFSPGVNNGEFANSLVVFNGANGYSSGGVLSGESDWFGTSVRSALGFGESTDSIPATNIRKLPMLSCDFHVFPFAGNYDDVRFFYNGFFAYPTLN